MSTPQNPGDGDTPQDPSDPQNPYGTPPPPPPPSTPPATPPPPPPPADPPPADPAPGVPAPADPATPPPPPTTPIPAAPIPAAPPPGGDPTVQSPNPMPPAYGDPNASNPMPPGAPPYGQPGQPGAPGQPAYAAPGYPSPMPGPAQPGKGMAITALILSFVCCLDVVGIILAIVVLVRSRDGSNRGKGLAIAALIVGAITLVITVVGGVAGINYVKDFKSVDDLTAGDCVTAKGLTDESASGVTQIKSVGCSDKHDGEVLSTSKLTADVANSYGTTSPVDVCTPSVTAAGSVDLLANPDLVIIALTEDSSPSSGDKLVCVIANADGSKLTSKLGT
jgi:hypothetical protein